MRRETFPVRVEVRDGEEQFRRVCATCGRDGRCLPGPKSGLTVIDRRAIPASCAWRPDCKVCCATAKRRRRGRDVGRNRAEQRAYYHANVERERENSRMRKRLRRERRGEELIPEAESAGRARGTRLDASAFADYLRLYAACFGLPDAAEIARDLGIPERRVRSVLEGEQLNVTVDLIDSAIQRARAPAMVGGVLVGGIRDLYPDAVFDESPSKERWLLRVGKSDVVHLEDCRYVAAANGSARRFDWVGRDSDADWPSLAPLRPCGLCRPPSPAGRRS